MPQLTRTPAQRNAPLLTCACLALAGFAGCARDIAAPGKVVIRGAMADPTDEQLTIAVSARQVWTDAGVDVVAGQPLTLTASGRIVACQPGRLEQDVLRDVGPEGTYLFSDNVADRDFPLPAAGGGPAPCYGLIARIGDGPPLFVGGDRSWIADRTGPLQLGINDFDVSDNDGQFVVRIDMTSRAERPALHERVYVDGPADGRPAPGCSVVVFYVDGLRPDVVREMIALGHLPHIQRVFLEDGAWLSNTVTAFPSDTITSNGTMWTGCFSDRHGLKGQVGFSRRKLTSESYLDPFGPQRSAQILAPQGIDGAIRKTQAAAIGLVNGEEAGESWLAAHTSSVAPLYEHLQAHGRDWAAGVLPVMTEVPPPLWSRSLTRYMPYFQSQRAWEYVDEANADYAVKSLLSRREAVTIIWLPETDTCSHKCSRGQFGMTRRTIAKVDRLLGSVVADLEAQGRLESTYLLLVSDHGHVGGRDAHLSQFDLATDFFFRPRALDAVGRWTGGGLGLSVRMHRHQNRHPEDSSKEFVFIDGDSDGAARIYLPRGHYRSRNWNGPNRPADLLQYQVDAGREPVDLPRSLASIRAVHGSGEVLHPIDLVLMKLTDASLLVSTADRGEAVIERRPGSRSRWEYRYVVVTDVAAGGDGDVHYRPYPAPHTDPLGLIACGYSASGLAEFHDERDWLDITIQTEYPDAVVALARHVLWDEELRDREREFAPDLVVTARRDWYFGTCASPGTMHGYPLAEAARAAWFVSGPNIRRGARIETPARLADLTPTILDMVGLWDAVHAPDPSGPQRRGAAPGDSHLFDGRPMRELYSNATEYVVTMQPVYWRELDLNAWGRLRYTPLTPSELLPRSIHDPDRGLDLNNVAYDVASVTDLSVFRLMDDVVAPLAGKRDTVTGLVERTESYFRRRDDVLVAQGARVPDVPNLALADYSFTSQGNLQRVDRALDWVQHVGETVDNKLAAPLERDSLPLTRPVNRTVDAVQHGFWETYRFGQRVVIHLVDERLLNGVENGTDRVLNAFRRIPSEVTIDPER
jgi:arylsulfatase A-like enzyme